MKSLLQDFGDYQIVEKLGRGGMADVYLAVNRKSNRRVALKLVEHGEGAEAQEILEAERLGAGLQQRLSRLDERIPQIHAFGDLLDCFFIEMEFVEGTDLSMLIGTGTLKPENAAGIAMELCDILRHAHSLSLQVEGRELRAIVHGDAASGAAGGVTVLMIEHVMQAVMNLAEHVWVLAQGQLIAAGTPAEVTTNERVIEAYLGHGTAARLRAAA